MKNRKEHVCGICARNLNVLFYSWLCLNCVQFNALSISVYIKLIVLLSRVPSVYHSDSQSVGRPPPGGAQEVCREKKLNGICI
jgi:hypothetical protein